MRLKALAAAVLAVVASVTIYSVVVAKPVHVSERPSATGLHGASSAGVFVSKSSPEEASPNGYGGDLLAGLKANATPRRDTAEAAANLAFSPTLPEDVGGRGELLGMFTHHEGDSTAAGGKDNVLDAVFAGDLHLIEKSHAGPTPDASSLRASQADPIFGQRTDEVVKTTVVDGTDVISWDPVNLPETYDAHGTLVLPGVVYENAEASWVSGGVLYVIGSPHHSSAELLEMAKSMIK